jgi:hypothetical protein
MAKHFFLEASPARPYIPDSSIGWKTTGLPEDHDYTSDFVDLVINDSAEHFSLPSHEGTFDLTSYIKGDLKAKSVRCQHHAIYVEGDIGENTRIVGRDGVLSARSLAPGSNVEGCSLIILENFGLSEKSRNFSRPDSYRDACVILVDPGKREEVFARVSGMTREYGIMMDKDTNKETSKLMGVLKKLNEENLLKGVQGVARHQLESAGINLPVIGRG